MSVKLPDRLRKIISDATKSDEIVSVPEQRIVHSLVKTESSSPTRAMLLAEPGEVKGPTVSRAEIETLLRIDGFTNALVEKYVLHIVRPGFYFDGQKGKVDICKNWTRKVRLKRALEKIVRTIYGKGLGIAWIEIGWTKEMNDIVKLRLIEPNSGIDFIREERTNFVKLDEYGDPVGYRQERDFMGNEVVWTKETIKKGNKVVWNAKEGQDGRDFIAYFTLFNLGEDWEPYSPLEGSYRDARARLNNTANIEETGFRGGSIVAKVGDPNQPASTVPEATIDQLADDLKNVSHQDIFVFRRDVELGTFPLPDLREKDNLLYFFTDLQCGAMQIPLTMMLEPKSAFKGEAESKSMEFENVVISLQERLAEQIEDTLIKKVMRIHGFDEDKAPLMKFRTFMPTIRLSRARRIGKLYSDGVLTYTKKTEKQIREEEGLPIDDISDIPQAPASPEDTMKSIEKKVNELTERLENEA